MPGHIGTEIVSNSRKIQSTVSGGSDVLGIRKMMAAQGMDPSNLTDEQIGQLADAQAINFRDNAPMTAAAAAKVMLDGVKADRWRILVGDDAHYLDQHVRATPEQAYTPEFYEAVIANTNWRI
jgi:hypothetical protein